MVVRDPNLGTGGFVTLALVLMLTFVPDLRLGIVVVVFTLVGRVLTPLDGMGALDLIVAVEVEVVEVEANLACDG